MADQVLANAHITTTKAVGITGVDLAPSNDLISITDDTDDLEEEDDLDMVETHPDEHIPDLLEVDECDVKNDEAVDDNVGFCNGDEVGATDDESSGDKEEE